MIDEAAALFDEFGGASRVVARRAVFAEVVSGVPWVDMGTSRFACDFGAGFVPRPGETVQILTVNDRHLLFPARALPGTGTVLTVTSGVVTVTTIAGTFSMPHVGTAPSSGDLVGISWSEQPFVLGKLSVQPPNPDPVPDPGGGGTVRSATFRAVDAGSTDRGSARWWQPQPWASNTTFGAWFYGSQIKDSIPSGAVLVSAEMWISRQQDSGSAPRFTLHTSAWKAGVPAMSPYLEWDPPGGWNTLPAGWFEALKAGGAYWGVGLNQGGFNKFSSLAQDSMSGALRISWR